MTIAWAFPGQGSQKVGMADEVLSLEGALKRFELASEILGRDLLAICRGEKSNHDEVGDLDDTRNTQPALFLVESLLIDDLKKQGREPNFVAGHSLGELVALYASEVFDLETALRLLKSRSELMAAAGGGAMTALIGFDRRQLEDLIALTEGVVIANDNSKEQVVLSGQAQSIELIVTQLKCKRVIPLKVSGAFHSPFMIKSSESFALELDKIVFNDGVFPVLSNVDPTPTKDGKILKEKLKKQMITGVRWRETMEVMQKEGVTTFVEVGPGKVLSGLVKRSITGISLSQLSSANDLGH
ncbi:ACP S-malonyltransferase [Prochlorococcus marinus]|uniref:ACP S-malonyltransferase n=1 Tax=Prochlorococcus marinus TaxID=1219 RepID=UPI0022B2E94B|nr:ACP S-malonyltransferase [Prochlorococcus marinus]